MPTPLQQKSTLATIERRFDQDVERFSNLETGQAATIDAPLAMQLITQAAIAATPVIRRVFDIGCGAGNNTLSLLRATQGAFDCHLNDLSQPMLDRAVERVSVETTGTTLGLRGDFRTIDLQEGSYDVILAAAVLHHLRDDSDWESAFSKIYRLLKPGGSIWITDLVSHESAAVESMMWARYGDYLTALRDEAYRDLVFSYIDQEDSPRPVTYQLDLLRKVGFQSVDLLHKNSCFAAFGAVKASH